MRTRFLSPLVTLLLALPSAVLSTGQHAGILHLEKEIPLPDVEGRIDHFSADVPGQRLFVAAIANGSVEVLDVQQGNRTAEIKGLKEPQGVLYDSQTGWLYVASGGDGKLHVYDGKSLTEQTTLEFGDDADNVRHDRHSGEVWVGFGNGGIGIVNAAGQKVGSVTLGSHPESFQFSDKGGRVYVNIPKQLSIAVIDRQRRAVVAEWGLGGSIANYPMAIDDVSKRLFVGCRLPARLVVLDTTSGRIVTSLPTVGDADDIFNDPGRHLVFVIGGEGAVEILRQHDPDHYEPVQRITTAPGARTGLFVAGFNRLFVAVPHRGLQSARFLVYQLKGG